MDRALGNPEPTINLTSFQWVFSFYVDASGRGRGFSESVLTPRTALLLTGIASIEFELSAGKSVGLGLDAGGCGCKRQVWGWYEKECKGTGGVGAGVIPC